MARVIYHNAVDILSLVDLTRHVLQRHHRSELTELSSSEALAVARWHEARGRTKPAEEAFRKAISSEEPSVQSEALRRYTAYLKREGRRAEALEGWKAWHQLEPSDPRPCIELAKYYEWEVEDMEAAMDWAQRGLNCLTHWPEDWRREQVWAEIEHRIRRLTRKLGSS
jgi:hypothetical protein